MRKSSGNQNNYPCNDGNGAAGSSNCAAGEAGKPLLVAIDGRCASGKSTGWQKIRKAAGLQRDPHG